MFHPWNTCPGSGTIHKGVSMNALGLLSRKPFTYGSIRKERPRIPSGTVFAVCLRRRRVGHNPAAP